MNNKVSHLIKTGTILILLMLISATVIVSCTKLSSPIVELDVTEKELTFSSKDYYLLTWVNNQLIGWVRGQAVGDYSGNRWLYTKQGDSDFNEIEFPTDRDCDVQTFYDVTNSNDGQVQVWKVCRKAAGALVYLMAYDWSTGNFEEIAGALPLGSSAVTWNKDDTRGIVFLDSGGYGKSTLYWIWKGGFGPMDLIISDNSVSWNTNEFFPDFQDADISITGDTGRADWSPNGETIAFWASGESVKVQGTERIKAKYSLYLMDAEQLQPHFALTDIYFPYITKWSPNSLWIAFIGDQDQRVDNGEQIWLYSVANDSSFIIAEGKFQDLLWSPDGKGLIAIRCSGVHECTKIVEFNLENIVDK